MRIGFAPAGSRDTATAVRMAVAAEQAGLDELWVSEDYLERGAFAVAGGIAAATSRAAIGLGVINPWTRHVALTAMECAALDELSGGRLVIGLGASNQRWMQQLLGIPFEKPIGRLVEYVEALRVLLAGERLTREVGGTPVDASLSFVPARTGIPIQLGVKGPVALRRGAEIADGFMLSVLASPAYVAWVREQYPHVPLTAYAFVSVDEDAAAARDRVRSRVARFLGMHGVAPITELAGVPESLALALQERMREGRDGADLVDDALLDRVAVAGSPADAAAAASRFADAGLAALVAMDDGVTAPERMVADVAAMAARLGG